MTPQKLRLICAGLDGWTFAPLVPNGSNAWWKNGVPTIYYSDELPNYPEDLNAVMPLAKAQATKGWRCIANMGTDGTWECFFTLGVELSNMPGRYDFYGAGDTLVLAMCEALARLHGKWGEDKV